MNGHFSPSFILPTVINPLLYPSNPNNAEHRINNGRHHEKAPHLGYQATGPPNDKWPYPGEYLKYDHCINELRHEQLIHKGQLEVCAGFMLLVQGQLVHCGF